MRRLMFAAAWYSLAVFYSCLVFIVLVLKSLIKPFLPFWYVKPRNTPPACLVDPQLGTHNLIQLKEVKLHYVEKGDRSKPLMLFVHGFPEFWYSWRHQMKEFSADYWTVAFDMRGYGDSEKPEGIAPYRIDALAEDIRELIEGLGRKRCDVLVGHDWGGVVCWHFLYQHPDLVDRYVIMGAAPVAFFAKLVTFSIEQFIKSWYTCFFLLPVLPEITLRSFDLECFKEILAGREATSDVDLEAYKYTFSKPGALTSPLNYYRANMWKMRFSEMARTKQVYKNEKMPAGLVIFGSEDKYLHPNFVRLSVERVRNLQGQVIPKGNHFIQQDEPELVNKYMRDFLA